MTGSRYSTHKQWQLGLVMTVQEQSLAKRTIQYWAPMSRVTTNSTLSLELVESSGMALPTLSTAFPSLQHLLSTLRLFPSGLMEQVAVVLLQPLSKQQGMTACSYQTPIYLETSTQGTVYGSLPTLRLLVGVSTMMQAKVEMATRIATPRIILCALIFLLRSVRVGLIYNFGSGFINFGSLCRCRFPLVFLTGRFQCKNTPF